MTQKGKQGEEESNNATPSEKQQGKEESNNVIRRGK